MGLLKRMNRNMRSETLEEEFGHTQSKPARPVKLDPGRKARGRKTYMTGSDA
jgi:hypothetical protein